ncbi:MAG: DNA polymerase III subunit delta [Muribaculaceae bacterium]|nr:DNA polymerase III subunit delta [Muribaculaceae bacterium]
MAAPSAPSLTIDALRRRIANGQYAPIYLLHGTEGFFIDSLMKDFERIVPDDMREFCLYVLYGSQTEPGAVMDLCMSVPMMAERQVVILKEAQSMRADQLERFVRYAQQPSQSTILVICSRGSDCKSKKLVDAVRRHGVVFQTPRIYDSNLPTFAQSIVESRGMRAGSKAVSMLCEFIGSDLSRMYNEVGKLADILGRGAEITPESIERNIGYSKDFNVFELIDSIATRDTTKTWRIISYFESNPKAAPLPLLLGSLYGLFANIMIAVYTPDRSPANMKKALGTANMFEVNRVLRAMQLYNPFQTIEIIDAIRRTDAMSKGNGSRQQPVALLRDLTYRIFTASGRLPV